MSMENKEITTTKNHFDLETIPAMYRSEARKFIQYVEEHGFTVETYQDFIESLRDDYKARTVNKHIAACRSVIRSMFDDPSITDLQKYRLQKALETVSYVKLAPSEKQVTGTLSPEEVETLVTRSPARTALIIRFLAVTGCRVSELTGIRLNKCKTDGQKAVIQVIGKGNKARTIRIHLNLYTKIRKAFPGEIFLFESKSGNALNTRNIYKEIVRLSLKHLEGKRVTPHDFRHYFATQKGVETGNWKGVSEYLGHASTQTTMDMYVHTSLSDADLGIA